MVANAPLILLIQKCCRGYLTRKVVMYERSEKKVNETYDYFLDMKRKLEEDSIVFIIYHWRKMVKRKKLKRQRLAEKEAASKGKSRFTKKKLTKQNTIVSTKMTAIDPKKATSVAAPKDSKAQSPSKQGQRF